MTKKRGRNKGSTGLIYTHDYVINKKGVKFSNEEVAELNKLVNKANYKRQKMMNDLGGLDFYDESAKKTGLTVEDALHKLGFEGDFVVRKKTKSLTRFQTKRQFERYIDNLKRVTNENYLHERVELYKNNYIKSMITTGTYDPELADIIIEMSDSDYIKFVTSNPNMTIKFRYEEWQGEQRFKYIKKTFDKLKKAGRKRKGE